jgi:hypothetical protein
VKEKYPPHVAEKIALAEAGGSYVRTKKGIEPLVAAPLPKAKGRIAKPRGMTGIEASWEAQLLIEKAAGEILWYKYEGITLKLADDTRYTPDFAVMEKDNSLGFHEVKGPYRREDSFVKLKVAASIFPFAFFMVTRDKDGKWNVKAVHP